MSEYFSVRNISFQYPSYSGLESKKLFDSLSFSMEKGETAVFMALPGRGKTTLSRIITSLVPAYTGGQLSGSITLDGEELTSERGCDIIEKAGIVFQNPDEQIFCATAEKELIFPLESLGLPPEIIKSKTDKAFDQTGTGYLRKKDPALLSGGEKRRLMISALCGTDPPLWILDETLEEVDTYARKEILDFLKKKGRTILILTSKMFDIYTKYADTFFIYNGRGIRKFVPPFNSAFIEEAKKEGFLIDFKLPGKTCLEKKFEPSVPETIPVIKLKDISFSYPDSGFDLKIENFFLEKGKTTAILGINGCGKTTLAKIMSGLLIPDSGEIMFKGEKASPEKLNRNCSYLFQNPDYQLFLPTVKEELEYGFKLRGKTSKEVGDAVKEAAELFLPGCQDAPPALMSYGMRKKLQAAIYYLLDKEIVIIDETDSGLSFSEYKKIIESFKKSPSDPAILIITHDIKLAAYSADLIFFMEAGSFTSDISKNLEKLIESTLPEER